MTKRFIILALVGFAILPQLSHGFTFLDGNSFYQKSEVLDAGTPTGEFLYALDYSRTDTESFTLSAQSSAPWSGVNSSAKSAPGSSGLIIDSTPLTEHGQPDPIPEPATLLLVGLGLVGAGSYRLYFRRA